jgi:hypothetical protein
MCYVGCGENAECVAGCDQSLVDDLQALPDDPRKWSNPPRKGTEVDSRRYRFGAIKLFQ